MPPQLRKPPPTQFRRSPLSFLTGAILIAAGAFKLGFLADFISLPVLAGFKAGTGPLIISGQLGKALGIDQSGDNFFQKTWSAITHLPDAQGRTVLLSAVTLALLVAIKRWAPRAFPGALVAVALGIVLSSLLDLDEKGVAVVGPVPAGLPGLELPDLGLLETLLPAAAGIALMSFVESIAAARAFVQPGDQQLKANRELIALGGANVGSGVTQGMPAGGGLSQTAVNDAAGARTPTAGAVTAGVALLTVLFLTGLFEELPQASLGAVVIVAAAGLVDLDTIRALGRIRGSALVSRLGDRVRRPPPRRPRRRADRRDPLDARRGLEAQPPRGHRYRGGRGRRAWSRASRGRCTSQNVGERSHARLLELVDSAPRSSHGGSSSTSSPFQTWM